MQNPPNITDDEGKLYRSGDSDYVEVRLQNLERTQHNLLHAIVDLQHRVSRLDNETVQWPGDTYEPTHTDPAP